MGKNKLLHFEENKTFPNFLQPYFHEIKDGYEYRGRWSQGFFGNGSPLVLELGCGKGEYSVGLARRYPEKNFVGVDKKGARMWRGAKTSQLEEISNVAFLRVKIEQIAFCFGKQEVDEIWITFPDPVPKKRRESRRLTSPKFLAIYKSLLKPGAVVHLKTDNLELYEYTLESLNSNQCRLIYSTGDLYRSGYSGDAPLIQTYYEMKYMNEGVNIKYLKFSFPDETE